MFVIPVRFYANSLACNPCAPKAATVVGRRRFDRTVSARRRQWCIYRKLIEKHFLSHFAPLATPHQEVRSSILPHVLASEILCKVAIKAADKTLFSIYQIPNRYVHLSSALDASGCKGESCAALAMAAWCSIEIMASSSVKLTSDSDAIEGDSASEEILLFPESAILDTLSRDNGAALGLMPIMNRLARNYIECRDPSKHASIAMQDSDDRISDILKNTLVGKVLEVASSAEDNESSSSQGAPKVLGLIRISKLFHSIVWNKKRYEDELSASEIASIIREIVKCTIKVTKNSHDDELVHHMMDELKLFLQAQRRRLGDCIEPGLLQVISSSLHVSFASRLIESRLLLFPRSPSWSLFNSPEGNIIEGRKSKLLLLAYNQLQTAERQFASAHTDESIHDDACFFAQWAAVQFHQSILFEHLSLAKLSQELRDASKPDDISVSGRIAAVGKKYTSALNCCR